jgi:hypothetical protein
MVRLARAREEKAHDVSDALADVALDEARPAYERQAALEALGSLGDPAVLPRLESLRGAADPSLRAYAEAATAALRARRRARGGPRSFRGAPSFAVRRGIRRFAATGVFAHGRKSQ